MAIDPVQPIQPIKTQQSSGSNPTEMQIKQLREIASQLMNQKTGNVYGTLGGIGKGFEDFTGKITGALDYNHANDMERQYLGLKGQDERNAIGKDVNPNAGAAPGGAAAPSPFQAAAAGSPQSQPPSQGQQVASLGSTLPSQGSGQSPTTTSTQTQGSGSPKLDLGGGPAEAAMRLSAKGETGKSTLMPALFNISGDTAGSKSYGPWGVNSRSGSAGQLVREHPELEITARPGSAAFDQQWRRAVSVHRDEMIEAHKDWHDKHIMSGLSDELTSRGVPKEIANDPRVQTYFADRKIQMGKAGLDASVRYALINSNNAEDFIKRVGQADRQRIPYNFQTYLRDRPNDVPGLNNRINLRERAALDYADPKSTGDIVDAYRSKNQAAGIVANGPQLAQNTGSMSQQMGDYLYNRAIHGQNITPAEAETMFKLKQGVNPQYSLPNDFGLGFRTSPGQPPQIYQVPGTAGKVENIEGIPGAKTQTTIGPDGRPHLRVITPEDEESNAGETTAPPPSKSMPQGAVVQNKPPTAPPQTSAPAAPAQPPKTETASNPLTVAAPQIPVKAGAQYAMADPNNAFIDQDGKFNRNKLSQVAQATSPGTKNRTAPIGEGPIETPMYDLTNPKTPIEQKAAAAIARANANPAPLDVLPNRYKQSQELSRTATGMGKIDVLKNAQNLQKIDTAAQEEGRKAEIKTLREKQEKYQNDLSQAVALGPDIKLARNILNSKDFEAGPVSWIVTNLRSLAKEGKDMFKRFADDSTDESSKAFWNGASKYFDNDHSASPNEVYQKILSGSILRSLRQMLGPNAGQFRVQELKMLEQAFGNQNLTLNANKVVMDMIDRENERAVLVGQMANEYLKTHHTLDTAFETELTNFERQNPVFDPTAKNALLNIAATGDPSGKITAPGPAPSPERGGPPQFIRHPKTGEIRQLDPSTGQYVPMK